MTNRCSIHGCTHSQKRITAGLCVAHYKRKLRHGDPLKGGTANGEPIAWVHNIVGYANDDCVEWPFARGSKGDSIIVVDGALTSASRYLCRLVNGDPENPKMHAAHSCGNGHLGCMNPSHLRWATVQENCADRIEHGTANRGSRHGNSKLSKKEILAIRENVRNEMQKTLARRYKISTSHVSAIINGKTWEWLCHG